MPVMSGIHPEGNVTLHPPSCSAYYCVCSSRCVPAVCVSDERDLEKQPPVPLVSVLLMRGQVEEEETPGDGCLSVCVPFGGCDYVGVHVRGLGAAL